MSERGRPERKGPARRSSGARPFHPGEAPLGVRHGLAGQRGRAGIETAARPPHNGSPGEGRGSTEGRTVGRRGGRRRLRPETIRALKSLAVIALLLTALIGPPALAASDRLTITSLRLDGLRLLDENAVRAASGVTLGAGLLSTDPRQIEQALGEIPFIASSRVRIGLPGEIRAELREEVPLLRWRSGEEIYLVSGSGELLGLTTSPLLDSAGRVLLEQLPLITDLRAGEPLIAGGSVSASDLDIATRLASLTLADLGSSATRLSIEVDPQYGFLLRAEGEGFAWNAVFGIYSATIRPPEMVPGQVRLLRSLLAGRERKIGWIILADGQAGTFTEPGVRPPAPPRASPEPSASPSPSPVLP